MKKQSILALDISSTSTGYAHLNYEGKILHYGKITPASSKASLPERQVTLYNTLTRLLRQFKPSMVVVEDIFVGPNRQTFKVLAECGGICKLACGLAKIPFETLTASQVRKILGVKGKLGVWNHFYEKLDFLEEHTFESSNDITDALGLGVAFLRQLRKD